MQCTVLYRLLNFNSTHCVCVWCVGGASFEGSVAAVFIPTIVVIIELLMEFDGLVGKCLLD